MRFNRFYVVGIVALFLAGLAVVLPVRKHLLGESVPHWATPQAEVLSEYCISTHDQAEKKGGLALDTVDFNRLSEDAEVWEKVIRKVRAGMMPPADEPRPRRGVLDSFAAGLEKRLDETAETTPNPGAPALHRLNRTEYANVIRDLLAVEVDVETLLPGDDSAEGFDNIADVLGVSPSLIEGYVSAAMKISHPVAVGGMPVCVMSIAPSRDWRRTVTSKASRWEHAAAYSCGIRFRWMRSTSSTSTRAVVPVRDWGVWATEARRPTSY